MCRNVFSRNRFTWSEECNLSFMYRKSPTNVNKVHVFIHINNKLQRMSTNEKRALGLRGCAESQSLYIVRVVFEAEASGGSTE